MRLTVDYGKCSGSANCVGAAPTVFDIGDADQVTLLMEDIPSELVLTVENAVRMCPQGALKLVS